MAVIMVSTLKVKDWDLLAEYRKGAGPIVRGHGGELLGLVCSSKRLVL